MMKPTFFSNTYNYPKFESPISNCLLDKSSDLWLRQLTLEDSMLLIFTHWWDPTNLFKSSQMYDESISDSNWIGFVGSSVLGHYNGGLWPSHWRSLADVKRTENGEHVLFICTSAAKGWHLSFVKSTGEGKKKLLQRASLKPFVSFLKTYRPCRRSHPEENGIDMAVLITQRENQGFLVFLFPDASAVRSLTKKSPAPASEG